AVDELLAGAGAPLELREGALGAVTVTVPWAALGTEPVRLRLSGVRLVLRPRRPGGSGSVSPPPGGSQEPQRGREPPPEPLEGLEALALTIDTVLRRLQVSLEDSELRVELPPQPGGGPGGALELHLPRAEFEDAGGGPGGGPPAVLLKALRLRELRLLWQELPPPWAQVPVSPPALWGLLPGPSELCLRLKQNEALPGPAVGTEG
ncbi:ATG2A protein, partial [Pomatostomus ruficeps]|nr:ATG2A protein [Pomatostomus ruficeps]